MTGACGWGPIGYERIIAWVRAHEAELPRTLDELTRFPVAFRRVIVNAVPAETRLAMWRSHLESFVGSDSPLTADQQTLVNDVIRDLPALFGGTRSEFESRARAMEDRMRAVMPQEQAFRIFAMLGPPEPPEGIAPPPDA